VERKIYKVLHCKRPWKSRKTISRTDLEILWSWERAESVGKKGDPRLFGLVQSMSKAIKTVIPMNPITRARKFVVDR
jgi:hypothetical protein